MVRSVRRRSGGASTLHPPVAVNSSILVPGTGGTTLVDNSGRDIGYPIRMRLGTASKGLLGMPAEAFRELLSMEHIPGQLAPTKTSLKPGTSLRPGHILQVAYNQIPADVNHFLYDWRADLRYSAGKLLEFMEHRKPAGGRWNVVGHSQGALLIVLASKMMDDPEAFSRLVASVTLVGAPLAGTINSYQALLTGEAAGKPAAGIFKEILRTWPALYQMLPAWPSVCTAPGTPCDDEEQLMSPHCWRGVPGIQDALLSRGTEVQVMLRDPLSHMRGDMRVGIFLARNRNTGVEIGRKGELLAPDPITSQKGDGLVPLERTLTWVGDHIRRFVVAFDAPAREHAFMLSDPAIATSARQQFR
jgi:pimeloyl-ACP methyl ester carboxylesterase